MLKRRLHILKVFWLSLYFSFNRLKTSFYILSFCHKLWFSNPCISATFDISNYKVCYNKFNPSLKYRSFSIRLQWYRDWEIWVCCKNWIPLFFLRLIFDCIEEDMERVVPSSLRLNPLYIQVYIGSKNSQTQPSLHSGIHRFRVVLDSTLSTYRYT